MIPIQKTICAAVLLLVTYCTEAQPLNSKEAFTRADTLRGSNGPGRNWWDVLSYGLGVRFNIDDSTISGVNHILFKQMETGPYMQIDLQEPLVIDSVFQSYEDPGGSRKAITMGQHAAVSFYSEPVTFEREGNVYFLKIPNKKKGFISYLDIYYHGKPRIARQPPWDGGLIWRKSRDGSPWISIACQGLGASVWYPCKDYQGDEPDKGMAMMIDAPDSLRIVGNGREYGSGTREKGYYSTGWEVVNPINTYNMIPYIGKYVQFEDSYDGEKGELTVEYWVLEENLEKAKKQFIDVRRTLKAFEHWFGPYPFYKDGYKIVEAPHLGMEHQSAIAYGNGYQNGYRGRDLSGSGWGLKWDFIIVHESGHEWWGNNITTRDIADMWVHESFTNYSETLFTEYYYGKEAGNAYVQGTRKLIQNDMPIIGPYGVNKEGSGDMYYKGGNMLHTIRQVINNDGLFRNILRGLNSTFYHKIVDGKQVESYISKQSKIDFSKVFDQYLRTTMIPELQYRHTDRGLQIRWQQVVKGFNMPVKVTTKQGKTIWLKPTDKWSLVLVPGGNKLEFETDPNFYISVKELKN